MFNLFPCWELFKWDWWSWAGWRQERNTSISLSRWMPLELWLGALRWNHGVGKVGNHLWDQIQPSPVSITIYVLKCHIHTFSEHFHPFPELFQCFATLSLKEFFLISDLNLHWHNLRPFPQLLPLEKNYFGKNCFGNTKLMLWTLIFLYPETALDFIFYS